MTMEVREATDGQEKIVEGYATIFDQPYLLWQEPGYEIWEQVDRRAFEGCDMSDVIMQYDHEGRVFARTSNGTLTAEPDDKGLHTVADLGGTDIGGQLYQEIKGGYTTKMSYAYRVERDRRETTEDHEAGTVRVLRTIEKIAKLYDVSAVSLPANDATSISARSLSEGVIAELREECLAAKARGRQRQKIKIITEVTK